MDISDLETPALVVDLDRMEKNIGRMADFAKECGVVLRPHAKTHKVPEIAKIQMSAGSPGVCLQKPSEVEVFAENGIKDIFLTNEVVSPQKLEKLARIAEKIHLALAMDNMEVVRTTGRIFKDAGTEVDIFVDVDVGMHRCGTMAKNAGSLAKEVSRTEGLVFKGIMGYEGHVNDARTKKEQIELSKKAMEEIAKAKRAIMNQGISVEVVSVGSSVSTWINAKHPDVTEVQPGMYIFNDHVLVDRGVAGWEDLALTVISTVMSKPAENRAIVDAGSKTFNLDTGLYPKPFDRKGINVYHFSEEHGWLHLSGEAKRIKVGERVRLVPAHCCTTVNQFDVMYGVRGDEGKVEKVFQILAAGKIH